MKRGWHPSMGGSPEAHRTIPERVVASFLGLMAEASTSSCDCCGEKWPASRIRTVCTTWHDEANACPVCRGCDEGQW